MKTYKVVEIEEVEKIWYVKADSESEAWDIAEASQTDEEDVLSSSVEIEEDDSINDYEEGLIKEGKV